MSISVNGQSVVPPGFRFHPTEEELLTYYLAKKVASYRIDLDVIPDVDLNKLEPWDIQERCRIGTGPQSDWYLFSHKDKKYPTGTRTNRATASGFWKATGRDKPIYSSGSGSGKIGMRKTLVFYKGRAPHGTKSDWIMHEYRLHDDSPNHQSSPGSSSSPIRGGDQQQEEGWVICRVFKKKNLICNNNSSSNQALVAQTISSSSSNNNNNNKQRALPSRSCSTVTAAAACDDSTAAAAQMLHHYTAAGSGDADTLDHILRYMGNGGKQESKPPPLASACSLPTMDLQYSLVNGGGGTLYDKFMKLPPLEHVVVSGSGGGLLQLPPPTEQPGSQYGSGDCWADTLASYELNGGLSDNDDGSTKTNGGGGISMSTPACFFVDDDEKHHQHGHGHGDGDLWSLARSSVSTLHRADMAAMNNV